MARHGKVVHVQSNLPDDTEHVDRDPQSSSKSALAKANGLGSSIGT
jgi:hypothetical protein